MDFSEQVHCEDLHERLMTLVPSVEFEPRDEKVLSEKQKAKLEHQIGQEEKSCRRILQGDGARPKYWPASGPGNYR